MTAGHADRDAVGAPGREGRSEQAGSRTVTVVRAVAVVITTGVGAAGFALSFTALRDLAGRGHVPAGQAWLWPLMVDGAILLATLGVVVMAGDPRYRGDRRFFWLVLIGGAGVSVACNALHAVLAPEAPLSGWLRGLLAAVAPLALLVTTHGLTLLTRMPRRTASPGAHARASATVPEAPVAERFTAEDAAVASPRPVPADSANAGDASVGEEAGPRVPARSRWHTVAAQVRERVALKDVEDGQVAQVLFLSFEQTLADREIGRRLRMSHHTVSKVVGAGGDVLRGTRDADALAMP